MMRLDACSKLTSRISFVQWNSFELYDVKFRNLPMYVHINTSNTTMHERVTRDESESVNVISLRGMSGALFLEESLE